MAGIWPNVIQVDDPHTTINAWIRLGFTPLQAAGLSLDHAASYTLAAELREEGNAPRRVYMLIADRFTPYYAEVSASAGP